MSKVLISAIMVALVAGSAEFLPMPKYGGYSLDYAKHGLYFSSAAYCSADSIKNWDCGEACKYHSGFKPIQVYDYQLYGETNQVFTGYSDSAKKFIVAF